MADKRFFTNTYVTGSGRQNYLRIDNLEDPLFTSFTFDIDYTTSPLFYTINNSYFDCANAEGLAAHIENALNEMYRTYMDKDQGYDILPVLSGNMIDGTKLGFGLQQNVYMDLPLYGATEYIYMVDKRNGGADQNDVRYNNSSNRQNSSGEYSNKNDSYKLGDAVKSVVNDSDKAWAERQQQQNQNQIDECNNIMNKDEVKKQHQDNYDALYGGGGFKDKLDNANQYPVKEKVIENGKEVEKEVYYTEAQLLEKVNEYKQLNDDFENLKKEIVDWANSVLSDFQRRDRKSVV